jgi:pre-mRNA-splicing factor 38B
MSRSALWRQEANVQDRKRHAEETFARVISEGRDIHNAKRGVLPLMGPDDTFNIHPVVLSSVAKSPYFLKCCDKLQDWNMVIDEIYYEVKHVEPWTAGKLLSLMFFFANNEYRAMMF